MVVNPKQLEEKQSPWISVEDRLPERGERVLVHLLNGVIAIGFVFTDQKIWSIRESGRTHCVTHWTPFPKSPIIEDNVWM